MKIPVRLRPRRRRPSNLRSTIEFLERMERAGWEQTRLSGESFEPANSELGQRIYIGLRYTIEVVRQ